MYLSVCLSIDLSISGFNPMYIYIYMATPRSPIKTTASPGAQTMKIYIHT